MESIDTSGSESGVSSTEGSSAPESPSPAASQTEGAPQEASAQPGTDKPAPFHEHPRFKELVNQKNEYAQRLSTYEQQVQQMRAQMQEMQKAFQAPKQEANKPSYDQVLSRLQQIDPEFGQFQSEIAKGISAVPELKQQLEEFKQWKQDMELKTARTQAESTLNQLYEQNKVPENYRKYYKSLIREMALDNGSNSMDDLPKFFQAVHQDVTKLFEDRDRSTRESYLADKKKDVTPATQTGGTPVASAGKDKPLTAEDRIKFVASELRRGKQSI